jgi:glycosyltransferase involved in cell wall biosynthesis
MKWIVCQIGAREHYAVARALHRRGELAALVTDLWAPPGSWLRRMTDLESVAGRFAGELGKARVYAPNLRMMFFALQARVGRWPLWKKILAENALFQKEAGKIIFQGQVAREQCVLFSYSYAARNLFREAKRRGWKTVLGQIDPGPGEQRLVDELRQRYPEWAGDPEMVPPANYWDDWREECVLADCILVNSEWSKSLLVKEGVPEAKIAVVPLAYAAESRSPACAGRRRREVAAAIGATWKGGKVEKCEGETGERRSVVGASGNRCFGNTEDQRSADGAAGEKLYPERFTMGRPMRVLFLGQANVRKGIQDLVEAAELLGEGPWQFDVVGRYANKPSGLAESVFFHGQVPRSEAKDWYDRADLFVLPTHSDGFALTQIEAMAHGLPVVATPCCGDVVRDGVNGILIPPGNASALAGIIRTLSMEPLRLKAMSTAAVETVAAFGIDQVGRNLQEVTRKHLKG